jgi:hypothetical protein
MGDVFSSTVIVKAITTILQPSFSTHRWEVNWFPIQQVHVLIKKMSKWILSSTLKHWWIVSMAIIEFIFLEIWASRTLFFPSQFAASSFFRMAWCEIFALQDDAIRNLFSTNTPREYSSYTLITFLVRDAFFLGSTIYITVQLIVYSDHCLEEFLLTRFIFQCIPLVLHMLGGDGCLGAAWSVIMYLGFVYYSNRPSKHAIYETW